MIICETCNDTHRMALGEREVPCTRCPVPCSACCGDAAGFTSAYCATTPCPCPCLHDRVRDTKPGWFRPRDPPLVPRAEAPWADAPLPEDPAIAAAHPMRTGRHDLYETAMRLVGAKLSKEALVGLVNWVLAERADPARIARIAHETFERISFDEELAGQLGPSSDDAPVAWEDVSPEYRRVMIEQIAKTLAETKETA